MTLFTTVYDGFLTIIRDYELDAKFVASPTAFYSELESYLIKSCPRFTPYSFTDLDYTLNVDPTLSEFDNNLSGQEINILAEYMCSTWIEKELNDNTQVRLKLQNQDYKTYAEANNLKEKRNWFNNKDEKINKLINQYEWTHDDVFSKYGLSE